jgi:hypothetical protein
MFQINKYKQYKFLILKCIIALTTPLYSCKTIDLSFKTTNGVSKPVKEYPYFKHRDKVKGFIEEASPYPMTVSISPPYCPSYSYTSWRGDDPNRSLEKCNDYIRKELINYHPSVVSRCLCKIAVKNMTIVEESLLMPKRRWSILKLFHKKIDGTVTTERGFLEYDRAELIDQEIKILNKKNATVCSSKVRFSILGKNKIQISCFGGTLKLKGKVWLEKSFSMGVYAVGSATTSEGSGIAFISGLSDSEIENNHPEFLKNVSIK